MLGGATSRAPRCPVASCCPSHSFGHGRREHSGLAAQLPCRHVSGFGSACPGGPPASVQPTAGASVPLHWFAPAAASASVHCPVACAANLIPMETNVSDAPDCSPPYAGVGGGGTHGGPRQPSNGGRMRLSALIGCRGLARARGCRGFEEGRGSAAPRSSARLRLGYLRMNDAPPADGPSSRAREGAPAARTSWRVCYLVDPASSHMLVSKIKPCMCKYEQIQTVKLRMAH